MHRTQILLETTQYRRLKARANRSSVSLGKFVRKIIDRYLGEEEEKNPTLESFAGCLTDEECNSTNFKKFLYPDASKSLR